MNLEVRPDKDGWIKNKWQCSWYGDTWQNCVKNNCKFLTAVVGICKVCTEHDNRKSSADRLPPVMLLNLCSKLLRDFTSCLQQQTIPLEKYFLDVEVQKIDDQFRKLHLAFKEQSGFLQMLQNAQACYTVQSFEKCWSPLRTEFEDLQRFCGAIESIMLGTSSIEWDFSLIDWTKDYSSHSLTDYSLESILNCKQ